MQESDAGQLEGPDYVALVIEWDDELDEMGSATFDEQPVELRPRLSHRMRDLASLRNVVIACATASVVALVTWRLRHRGHA
ncbi:MAG: hypothetical protein SFX73_13155 [Kofleriaceae bacterium]|nr:hypothetical protein [Kofleriaceae bacterium]